MDEGWRRVGARIDTERARRGWSIAGFGRAAGIGKSTVDKLIHARRQSYDAATIAAVEMTLHWSPGSIERIRRGLEPQVDQDPDLTAIIAVWPRLSEQARRMLREVAERVAELDR